MSVSAGLLDLTLDVNKLVLAESFRTTIWRSVLTELLPSIVDSKIFSENEAPEQAATRAGLCKARHLSHTSKCIGFDTSTNPPVL